MDSKSIILLVVAILFVLIAGAGIVIFYQSQLAVSPQSQVSSAQVDKMSAVIQLLSSKTIPSIVAYGQVTKINGKNITLTNSGDSLNVKIRDDAQIYSFTQSATAPVQQKAAFQDIKTGVNINISLKLLPDATLEGVSVIILPSLNK